MVEVITYAQFTEMNHLPSPSLQQSAAWGGMRFVRGPNTPEWMPDGQVHGDENFIVADTRGCSEI